jgi:NAD(P)H-flavin reductase
VARNTGKKKKKKDLCNISLPDKKEALELLTMLLLDGNKSNRVKDRNEKDILTGKIPLGK